MQRDELSRLPILLDVATAARVLGIGTNKAYELIRVNRFPVQVLHLGRVIRIPTEPLLELLGFAAPDRDAHRIPRGAHE
jgi:hypothetical protein